MLLPEIHEEIIGHLWDDEDTLRACSLVCWSFVEPSQKLLFSNVVISSPSRSIMTDNSRRVGPRSTAPIFLERVQSTPHICQYVRRLEILDVNGKCLVKDNSVQQFLPLLVNLEELSIQQMWTSSYAKTSLPESLIHVLFNVVHLPGLQSFGLTELPLVLIKHGPQLRHLSFEKFLPLPDLPGMLCSACNRKPELQSLYLQVIPSQASAFTQGLREHVDMRKIKRLVVEALHDISSHESLFSILQNCSNTLEELLFDPCTESKTGPSFTFATDWTVYSHSLLFSE